MRVVHRQRCLQQATTECRCCAPRAATACAPSSGWPGSACTPASPHRTVQSACRAPQWNRCATSEHGMAVTAEIVGPMLVGDEEKKIRPGHALAICVRLRERNSWNQSIASENVVSHGRDGGEHGAAGAICRSCTGQLHGVASPGPRIPFLFRASYTNSSIKCKNSTGPD